MSVFRVMVFIETTLIMDCGIKMSLLTFKSPFERVGSFSLWGLVAVKPRFNLQSMPAACTSIQSLLLIEKNKD